MEYLIITINREVKKKQKLMHWLAQREMVSSNGLISSAEFSQWVLSDSFRPKDCSTPGLPVHHQLPEFTQTHVHWVNDAIQPSHSLLSPSPPAFNLSQHQGLFKWVSFSNQWPNIGVSASTSVLQMNNQDWFPLGWTGWNSLQSKGTPKSLLQHHSSKAKIL